MKKTAFIALLLAAMIAVFLTGCGKQKIKYNNPDGTVTSIEFSSAAPFQRLPVFEVYGNSVNMKFNGITWYRAGIVSVSEAERYADKEVYAKSSNMKVYEADENEEFQYVYILKLEGTDESFICFETDADPYEASMGNDLTTEITYSVGGVSTVPDLDGLRSKD